MAALPTARVNAQFLKRIHYMVARHGRQCANLYQFSIHGRQRGLGGFGDLGEREVEARFTERLIAVPERSLQRVGRLLQQRTRLIPAPQPCNALSVL